MTWARVRKCRWLTSRSSQMVASDESKISCRMSSMPRMTGGGDGIARHLRGGQARDEEQRKGEGEAAGQKRLRELDRM